MLYDTFSQTITVILTTSGFSDDEANSINIGLFSVWMKNAVKRIELQTNIDERTIFNEVISTDISEEERKNILDQTIRQLSVEAENNSEKILAIFSEEAEKIILKLVKSFSDKASKSDKEKLLKVISK